MSQDHKPVATAKPSEAELHEAQVKALNRIALALDTIGVAIAKTNQCLIALLELNILEQQPSPESSATVAVTKATPIKEKK